MKQLGVWKVTGSQEHHLQGITHRHGGKARIRDCLLRSSSARFLRAILLQFNLRQLKDSKTQPRSPVASWLSVEELIQLANLQRSIWRHDLPLWSILLCSISYSGQPVKLSKHEPLSRSALSLNDLGTTPHVLHHAGRMSKVIRIPVNFPSVFSDCHYECCNIG